MAYHRLSFRIYGVSATYVWRISRINGRMCYVCATYVSLLWSMCDVLSGRNILWRSKRYVFVFPKSCIRCFSRFGVPYRLFSQGYAWCSLCLCHVDQDGELGEVPPPTTNNINTSVFFFGVNLDYLDFSGGIFDL